MDQSKREPGRDDRAACIEALVRQLGETEHALQELLAGEVDAVVDPVRGTPIILRQAQAELRRSEARMRLLLEQLPAVVWTTDGDLRLTSIAGKRADALGVPVEALIERSLVDVLQEHAGLEGILAAHYRALEGQQASYDATLGERVFHGIVEPLWDEAGRIAGCAGLGLDVTRQRRIKDAFGGKLSAARRELEALAERGSALAPGHRALVEEVLESSFVAIEELQVSAEELHQQNEELIAAHNDLEVSRRRYRDLFESAPDGYLVTDPAGVIRRANQAAVDLLGVGQQELQDKPLVLYVAEGDRTEFHRRLDRVRAGKGLGGVEWEMGVRNRADGAVFPAALTVSPIHDAQGELTGLRWLVRDISPSKRAEERERLLEEARVAAEEAQAANTLLRTLLDTMPIGVVVCDAQGSLLMTNPPGEEILGSQVHGDIEAPERSYTPLHVDGSPFPAEDMPLARAMELGETVENVEILVHREDGSQRTILAGAAPVRDGAGQIVSGVAVFQDITARKKLETALEEERARLSAIIESAPEGIVVADAEAQIVMTNPAADALYARPVPYGEDHESHASLSLCTPDGTPCEARDLPLTRSALDGTVIVNEELAIVWPDGQRRELLVNAAPVQGSDGKILGAVGLFQDVTEQVERRREIERLAGLIERERTLLETVIENTHAHLAYLDADFNFVTVNSAYASGSGYAQEELVGRNHFDLFPHAENRAIFERVRETGKPLAFQARPFEFPDRPDQGTTYWDWALVPVKDGDGQVQGLVLSLLDVTERERSRQALLESEERFRTVADFAYDWEYWIGADGGYVYVSPSCQRITGYHADEFLRDPELMLSIVHPADRERVAEHLGQPLESNAEHYMDFRILTRDGEERWISHTCQAVYGGDGTWLGRRGSHRDITERKWAEERLHRYADRLQGLHETDRAILAARSMDEIAEAALERTPALLDCVRADVMLYDRDGGEMTLLAAHAASETHVGKGWRGPIDDEWAHMLEGLGRGATITLEDVQRTPSDSPWREALRTERVRALVVAPLIVEDELIGSLNLGMREPEQLTPEQMEIARELAIQLAIGIHQARLREQVRRYTQELERRVQQRTAALQASQARLQAIFDNAPIGIALVDMQGHVIESNPGLQKMLGYSAEELKGMHFVEFTHPADVEEEEVVFQELLTDKRPSYSLTKRYILKDGGKLWANLHVSFVRDAQGRPQFGIGLAEDITERRKAQEALIQSEKLALTGRLAASLAHEINNPLQSVIGCLDLARESLVEGQQADASQMLQIGAEELQRAASIVVQLRDLNQPVEPGNRELADVKDLLEHVLLLTEKQCRNHHVEVDWEPGRDLPWSSVAPDQIKQVFLNLILNAVEAMSDGGRLAVQATRTGEPDGVRFTFTDTGRGIPSDVLPNIFDPFYTTKERGLGLGLYVTQSIVDAHGGRVDVESQVGEGTTFTVWLPAGGGTDGG